MIKINTTEQVYNSVCTNSLGVSFDEEDCDTV